MSQLQLLAESPLGIPWEEWFHTFKPEWVTFGHNNGDKFWVELLTIPIFSAIAGVLTNWTGVLMLFVPINFTGFYMPGVRFIFPWLPRKVQILPVLGSRRHRRFPGLRTGQSREDGLRRLRPRDCQGRHPRRPDRPDGPRGDRRPDQQRRETPNPAAGQRNHAAREPGPLARRPAADQGMSYSSASKTSFLESPVARSYGSRTTSTI